MLDCLNWDRALQLLQAVDEAVTGDAEHLLRRRFVLEPQDRRVGICILVEEPFDPVGEPLECSRQRQEMGGRVEDAEKTGFEYLMQLLLCFVELMVED